MRVPRGKLRQLLYEKLRNLGGDVQWGKDLRTFAQDPGTLLHTLTFSDGSSILDCGLLVGADGVRSAVQKLLPPPLPPSLPTPPPRYTGIFLAIGTSTYVSPLTTERGFYTLDGNSRLFLMPFSGGALSTNPDAPPPQPLTMWQLSFNCPLDVATSLRSSPPLDLHNHILSLVASHHDPIHPLISETDPATVWGTPLVDRDPAPVTSSQNKDGAFDPNPFFLRARFAHSLARSQGASCSSATRATP
jgi:2-polyprenyl-6-methoxyphenol hydroxylase-like FAD-dependent oxidoreductase